MARTSKDKSEIEHLRGEIRELEKLNKALKKRLRQLEKSKHIWQQYALDADDKEEVQETKETPCPSCETGIVIYTDLGIKNLFTCSTCPWRKTSLK